MFSHVVIFWTNPSDADATDQVVANAKKYLPSIPGIVSFHVGRMSQSHRSVVDQSYQVGLNIQFETKQAQDAYHNLWVATHRLCYVKCGFMCGLQWSNVGYSLIGRQLKEHVRSDYGHILNLSFSRDSRLQSGSSHLNAAHN
jgi:hypothetical protein